MHLPLLERATPGGPQFCLTPLPQPASLPLPAPLIPTAQPRPGEQYRFHFDMSRCIGCHCCEVACNEQNGNPAHLNWRRVGEIEGGVYPQTRRQYLSMGCNHCVDPSCLRGCPVDAYTKDSLTGIVQHSADACIGCQYCTWNCQYGVPQYNSSRGVVGKCDMCYGRLTAGLEPACVNACPEQAIRIEIVNIAAWREQYREGANAPGMPVADETVSTTRITLPLSPIELRRADYDRVRPEHPHWPLVFMTVLTQLSAWAFAAIWILSAFQSIEGLGVAAAAAFGAANLALAASTLHLGRPIHAYRALRMWKRSWLSREVVLFTLFAGAASSYALLLLLKHPIATALGVLTVLFGFAGVTASAFIYLVPARPSWNSRHTVADFHLTGALLGIAFVRAVLPAAPFALYAGLIIAGLHLLNQGGRFLWLTSSEEFELRASSRLLSMDLARLFMCRVMLLVAGGFVLPLLGQPAAALAACLIGELLGRYLFFVSAVPKNIAASFARRAA